MEAAAPRAGGAGRPETPGVRTSQIRLSAQKEGRASIAWGLCVVAVCSAVAAAFIVYAVDIPDTCESRMKSTFLANGILNALNGILALCTTYMQKAMLVAMSHHTLFLKWAGNPARTNQAQKEQDELEHDIIHAAKVGGGIWCFSCLLTPCMMFFGIYGIIQAAQGTDENCGGSITVFCVLFSVSLVIFCMKDCGQCFMLYRKFDP